MADRWPIGKKRSKNQRNIPEWERTAFEQKHGAAVPLHGFSSVI
jgi:hypothetical protein